MCLNVTNPEIQTAVEDIVVYKHLAKSISNEYLTSFRNFPIEIGKMYESNLFKQQDFSLGEIVEIGLHSFPFYEDALKASKYLDETLVKCIIPKGSNYYIGTFENYGVSYASNKLKYIKILDKETV